MRTALLGVAIGLALADSSIVTLALPDILREFAVSITSVAWTLTAYNLAFCLLAVPAAIVARRSPRGAFAGGAVVFALASTACGLAWSFDALVGARAAQARGNALKVTAALVLLFETVGSEARAARIWVGAGVVGAALGPAAGGVLTQLAGWESIFLAQVPVVLALVGVLVGMRAQPLPAPAERPHWAANAGLLLLSGGLVAALFLVVLLLVDGWGMPPALAGLVVTVMPLAAIAASRFTPGRASGGARMAAGVLLVGGGLVALALLPRAGWAWTIPPQLLVGVGIGLALVALTERAVAGRADQVVHGGWTLASRHAGVVVGLLLLAPVLTSALERNEDLALRAGTAAVLDAPIPPLEKLRIARGLLAAVDAAEAKERPDVASAFEGRPDEPVYRELLAELEDQLDRAITSAFTTPFLISAGLALLALIPVAASRGEPL
jgi:predicted MFS family arabinose efflux permease